MNATYTDAQRAAVVARVAAGERRADVARDLGIPPSNVSSWVATAGQPKKKRGGAHLTPAQVAQRVEARAAVSAGTPRPLVAQRLGVGRQTVLTWTRDLPAPQSRMHARNGLQDDGIVDEVAVERALRFDPATIGALRPLEHIEFTRRVKALLSSPWFEQTPRYEAWLALPEADRRSYAEDPVRRARRLRTVEAVAA